MSVSGVARGGLFLFLGSLFSAVLGFMYWFLVSIFGGTEVVGIASSIYSLSALVSGIAVLGVPSGVQRFMGSSYGQRNVSKLNTYFWSSLTFVLILSVLSGTVIWFMAVQGVPLLGFSETMLISTGLLVSLGFWAAITALFTSIIKTEKSTVSVTVSTMIRLFSGVFLVYLGFGWFGAVAGLLIENLFIVILMLFFALRELKRLGGVKTHVSLKAVRESLQAGIAGWLPGVIALIGQQLSFLFVFGLQGAFEEGTYYIAYAIFGLVYMVPNSFMLVLFPILSGLTERSGEVAWRVLKLCLALACPSTIFLILYSTFPLSIMGVDYIQAAPTLSLLALSTIPLTFISAVTSLVYARGFYRRVLGIGLATNVPRVILYLLLVPLYGGFGAAVSFLLGSFIGLAGATFVSRRVEFPVSSGKIGAAIIVPFVAGLLCFLLNLSWYIGGMLILLVSVFCYARLGVVERVDLAEIAQGFASEKTIAKIGERLNRILRIMYGE